MDKRTLKNDFLQIEYRTDALRISGILPTGKSNLLVNLADMPPVPTRWGNKVPNVGQDIDRALTEYVKGATPRIAEGKAVALKAAEHWRDFILHNYGAKTYGDLTWAYVMPYRFWYSRTYKNWMKRLVSDPHIVAGYVKYKNRMAKENADKPEFYRGQKEIKSILGFDLSHPLIFNLEAAINPLNGITGADFNDKEKRVNWWTSSLDDMNKMGPTMFAPLQWGIATALSMQGEADAASRWAGRAIPETAPLKSLLATSRSCRR